MSTKQKQNKQAKKATKAKMATALGKQRNIQAMRSQPRDALSQKQYQTNIAKLDDATECEIEYLAARLDPFNAKENPCSLGYKNIPSIVVKKQARFQFVTGTQGLGFIAVNPYLALTEDLKSIAYSNTAYADANAWTLGAGVTEIPCPGGVFTQADLQTHEDQPGAVCGRVVSGGIRIKPMGAAVKTQGIMIGRQITAGGDVINLPTIYPTSVQVNDALQDLTKPIFNITNDGEWTTILWNPLTVVEGDMIPHEYFTSSLDVQGASLWLGIQGGEISYPFIGEVVICAEYVSLKKALGLSKPSHQNQQVSSLIDTVVQSASSFHGAPLSLLYEGAAKLGTYLGFNPTAMTRKVLDKIADDGTWAAALGSAIGAGAASYTNRARFA